MVFVGYFIIFSIFPLKVYCQSHVPKTSPGRLDGLAVGIKQALNVPKKSCLINEQIRMPNDGSKPLVDRDALSIRQVLSPLDGHHLHYQHHQSSSNGLSNGGGGSGNGVNKYPAGHFDATALHIQHAVQQTKLKQNGLRHAVRPGIESRINDFLVSLSFCSQLEKLLSLFRLN